jgi:flagellar protein FlaG
MSDPISPAGNQGPSPPAAAYVVAQSTPAAAKGVSTTVASAEAQAIRTAAVDAEQASKVEFSSASGAKAGQPPPSMTMEEAAQAFQSYLKSLPSNLQFQPDYQAGIVVFKVINPVTQKVIRQLPPEEVVQQARRLRMAEKQDHSGILLDKSL